AVWRDAGVRRYEAGDRLQGRSESAGEGDHAAHEVGAAELAVEPVRRRLYGGRIEGVGGGAGRLPARARVRRRYLRAPDLWRLQVLDHRPGRAAPLRSHADHEWRVESLFDDRLAHWLCGRAGMADQGDGCGDEPVDLEPVLDRAMGVGGSAERHA